MITVRGAVGLAALAALAASSCKSTQPTQGAKHEVALSFSSSALLDVYDCWDATGLNAPPSGVYCEQNFDSGGNATLKTSPLPWLYDLEISVIPAGKIDEQVIASSVDGTGNVPPAFPVFGNLTDYDTFQSSAPSQPARPVQGVTYSNAREVTQGSRTYGRFANFNYPEPNVLNQTPPYTFEANRGDTIIVRARKIKIAENPTPGALNKEQGAELSLNGALTINGVAANAIGSISSSTVDGSGVTFSFTIR